MVTTGQPVPPDFSFHANLSTKPLDVNSAVTYVSSPHCGAVSLFLGVARCTSSVNKLDDTTSLGSKQSSNNVIRLHYEAYDEMALKVFRKVIVEAWLQWPDIRRVYLEHKVGPCELEEAGVIVAVSSPHRKAALAAVSYLVDELKTRAPIWKKEIYLGSVEIKPEWCENVEGEKGRISYSRSDATSSKQREAGQLDKMAKPKTPSDVGMRRTGPSPRSPVKLMSSDPSSAPKLAVPVTVPVKCTVCSAELCVCHGAESCCQPGTDSCCPVCAESVCVCAEAQAGEPPADSHCPVCSGNVCVCADAEDCCQAETCDRCPVCPGEVCVCPDDVTCGQFATDSRCPECSGDVCVCSDTRACWPPATSLRCLVCSEDVCVCADAEDCCQAETCARCPVCPGEVCVCPDDAACGQPATEARCPVCVGKDCVCAEVEVCRPATVSRCPVCPGEICMCADDDAFGHPPIVSRCPVCPGAVCKCSGNESCLQTENSNVNNARNRGAQNAARNTTVGAAAGGKTANVAEYLSSKSVNEIPRDDSKLKSVTDQRNQQQPKVRGNQNVQSQNATMEPESLRATKDSTPAQARGGATVDTAPTKPRNKTNDQSANQTRSGTTGPNPAQTRNIANAPDSARVRSGTSDSSKPQEQNGASDPSPVGSRIVAKDVIPSIASDLSQPLGHNGINDPTQGRLRNRTNNSTPAQTSSAAVNQPTSAQARGNVESPTSPKDSPAKAPRVRNRKNKTNETESAQPQPTGFPPKSLADTGVMLDSSKMGSGVSEVKKDAVVAVEPSSEQAKDGQNLRRQKSQNNGQGSSPSNAPVKKSDNSPIRIDNNDDDTSIPIAQPASTPAEASSLSKNSKRNARTRQQKARRKLSKADQETPENDDEDDDEATVLIQNQLPDASAPMSDNINPKSADVNPTTKAVPHPTVSSESTELSTQSPTNEPTVRNRRRRGGSKRPSKNAESPLSSGGISPSVPDASATPLGDAKTKSPTPLAVNNSNSSPTDMVTSPVLSNPRNPTKSSQTYQKSRKISGLESMEKATEGPSLSEVAVTEPKPTREITQTNGDENVPQGNKQPRGKRVKNAPLDSKTAVATPPQNLTELAPRKDTTEAETFGWDPTVKVSAWGTLVSPAVPNVITPSRQQHGKSSTAASSSSSSSFVIDQALHLFLFDSPKFLYRILERELNVKITCGDFIKDGSSVPITIQPVPPPANSTFLPAELTAQFERCCIMLSKALDGGMLERDDIPDRIMARIVGKQHRNVLALQAQYRCFLALDRASIRAIGMPDEISQLASHLDETLTAEVQQSSRFTGLAISHDVVLPRQTYRNFRSNFITRLPTIQQSTSTKISAPTLDPFDSEGRLNIRGPAGGVEAAIAALDELIAMLGTLEIKVPTEDLARDFVARSKTTPTSRMSSDSPVRSAINRFGFLCREHGFQCSYDAEKSPQGSVQQHSLEVSGLQEALNDCEPELRELASRASWDSVIVNATAEQIRLVDLKPIQEATGAEMIVGKGARVIIWGLEDSREKAAKLLKSALSDTGATVTIKAPNVAALDVLYEGGANSPINRTSVARNVKFDVIRRALTLTIVGDSQNVQAAKEELQSLMKPFDEYVEKTITIASSLVPNIIGKGGVNINRIRTTAGVAKLNVRTGREMQTFRGGTADVDNNIAAIVILGHPSNVKVAEDLVEDDIKRFGDWRTQTARGAPQQDKAEDASHVVW